MTAAILTDDMRALAASWADAIPLEPAGPDLAAIAAYEQALKDHDWDFEFSDDHSVYQRGHNALARLRRQQRELDADGVLWNVHCPVEHRLVVQQHMKGGAL